MRARDSCDELDVLGKPVIKVIKQREWGGVRLEHETRPRLRPRYSQEVSQAMLPAQIWLTHWPTGQASSGKSTQTSLQKSVQVKLLPVQAIEMQRPRFTPKKPDNSEQKALQSCAGLVGWALATTARAVKRKGMGEGLGNGLEVHPSWAQCKSRQQSAQPTEHRDKERDNERKLGHA